MDIGIKIAKNELSRIIKLAMAGEVVVITNHGKPLVRLVPELPKPKLPRRGAGYFKAKLNLYPGWDSPDADGEFLNQFDYVRESKGLPPL